MDLLINSFQDAWKLLLDASFYVLFGILVSGIIRAFISPAQVSKHLGGGRFMPVIKAAIFGIPLPLCSCGVLPAAASLKKQGATNGATAAFLISTPESGVDSIAITYALLDPIMTVARPVVAFLTAVTAGVFENILEKDLKTPQIEPDLTCTVDGCCNGIDCPPDVHSHHHTFFEKIKSGIRFAIFDVWDDLASWFFLGLLIAGVITATIPQEIFSHYLGGGLSSMLIMLAMGIPLYICATASTPIGAAFILKGASPGAALVFLIAGPATNATSLSVVFKILGKRATAVYLGTIMVLSLLSGLILDRIYVSYGISARAVVGQASEIIPKWLQLLCAFLLIGLSIKPLASKVSSKFPWMFTKKPAVSSCSCIKPEEQSGKCGQSDEQGSEHHH